MKKSLKLAREHLAMATRFLDSMEREKDPLYIRIDAKYAIKELQEAQQRLLTIMNRAQNVQS